MMFTILRPDERAEEMERELEELEKQADQRWFIWMLVIACLSACIIGVFIGVPIGRLLP